MCYQVGVIKRVSFRRLTAVLLAAFVLASILLGQEAASRSLFIYVGVSRHHFEKQARRCLVIIRGKAEESVSDCWTAVRFDLKSKREQQISAELRSFPVESAHKEFHNARLTVQSRLAQPEQTRHMDRGQQRFKAAAGNRKQHKASPLLLRYTACSGLINQYYSHIAAFALASVISADVVFPPALHRNSFKHHFSVEAAENEVVWSQAPPDSLLDVPAITRGWGREGMHVIEAPTWAPLPNTSAPAEAYPTYPHPGADPRLTARVSGVYLQPRDLDALAQAALEEAARVRAAVQEQDPGHGSALVVLDLPCTMFAVRSASALPLVSKVARSLDFNPSIKLLAERVVATLEREGGQQGFNGAHLRLEKDASDWQQIMGGTEHYWNLHIQAMQAAGFDSTTPLYVACGLLSYGAHQEWGLAVQQIRAQGVGSAVWSKEKVLSQQELDALNTEQKALVDLLVLARARRLVGFGASSFSFFLREYRALHGLPRDSTLLVNASRVGTDPLFASAGVLAPPDDAPR